LLVLFDLLQKQWLSVVVPAQAGIRRSKAMWLRTAITETLVVMGPRLRGDDSGLVRAKTLEQGARRESALLHKNWRGPGGRPTGPSH